MSGDATEPAGGETGTRTATVRTTHADAALVRAALAPDNTDSMDAHVDGDAVECTVERDTTGGLRSTVDDYVVNLQVADRVAARARAHRDGGADADADTDADADADADTGTTAESAPSGDGPATDTTDTHHNT